jgi:hypothetical protein
LFGISEVSGWPVGSLLFYHDFIISCYLILKITGALVVAWIIGH